MKLESVRELKRLLPEMLAKHFSLRPALHASAAIARAASHAFLRPSYALGVATKNKTYVLAVRLQQRALEQSEFIKAIRSKAKGEIDVRYVGRVHAAAGRRLWYQSRQRPLLIGGSIGFDHPEYLNAGSIGCFVRRGNSSRPLVLSNNHVLADENRLKRGAASFQPGTLDRADVALDRIAGLKSFVRLQHPGKNLVDAAVTELDPQVEFDPTHLKGLGELAGLRSTALDIGEAVHKIGRTTGLRAGRVTAIELDNVVVGYDTADFSFDNQIEIEGSGSRAFADQGDSGSLIVDSACKAAGLLFACGDHGGANGKGLTYANPIGRVFDAMSLKLVL